MLVRTFQSLVDRRRPERRPLAPLGGDRQPVASIALVLVQRAFFGTPVWHSALAILLAIPLGLVALRVLGETNWGPISTMANLTQALFGVIAPGNLSASMVSSAITSAVAAESEGLMQDYKAGSMIGSTPRILTYMQLIAVPVGALALAFMYPLLRDTYGIIGEHAQLSSPTSQRWVGFAKIVTQQLTGPAALTPAAIARLEWMKWSFGDRGGVRRALHAAGAAEVMATVRAVAHRHGHRRADPDQRGHDDLPRRAGRLDLGEDEAAGAPALFDRHRVGIHCR